MSGGSSDFHAGRKVGKYEILTLLSMGGMAELFLAFTAGPGGFKKFVALKQILPDVKKDEAFVKMFLDEARITAAFSHANIGQVFDLGEEEGELYLAMEYISGQNLEQVFRAAKKANQELPLGLAVRVGRDTCLGLHYAHHFVEPSGKPAPAIHRDVSPKNVMVTFDGHVKVIDFGIAKAKGKLGRTSAGVIKGTTNYMSPEQVRNTELDGRSDLFAAGIMVHELLTGERLFEGNNDATTMMRITDGDFPSPRDVNPKVPQALSDAVMKALAVDPAARYATGKEMARALEAAAEEVHDEDQAAEFMQALFADRVKKTRALLDLAGKDESGLDSVASALRDEEGGRHTPSKSGRGPPSGRTPPPQKGRTPPGRAPPPGTPPPRTPKPRMPEAPARGPRRSASDRAPVAAPVDTTDDETPPPAASPKDRFKSQVAESYALYGEADEATQSLPGKRRPARSGDVTGVRPALGRGPDGKKKRRWYGVSAFWVVLLALVGGVGFASTRLDGPVGDFVRPWADKAADWYAEQTRPDPGIPADSAIVATDSKAPPSPRALALIAQREAEEEAARISAAIDAAEAERLANLPPPEPPPPEPPPPAPVKAGSTKVKPAAAAVTTPTPTPAPKQPVVARPAAGGLPATTVTQQDTDAVEVIDTRDAKAAAKGGLGFLTLYTVPSVWVYDGATSLGATPLQKVPLPSGTYRLRVQDAEGTWRMLSAPIEPGKVRELKVRVSDLPLDPRQD